ncbi:MAG: hypothetical protein EON59_05850 [Alphaproteobacteria bacterium]|nr:MAG: hypothetical protein EON59_05850 [Alphaproteobacteria bacterium]
MTTYIIAIDCRPEFISVLKTVFDRGGVSILSLSSAELVSALCDVDCSSLVAAKRSVLKTAHFEIELASVAATFAEPMSGNLLGAESDSDFVMSERIAILAFFRRLAGRAVNPPTCGSFFSYTGSLLEQWEVFSASGTPCPSWRIADPGEIGHAEVQILRPFDLRLRMLCDTPEDFSAPALPFSIAVQRPKGTVALFAFCSTATHNLLVTESGLIPFSPPRAVGAALARAADLARRRYGLDYGEIVYSHLVETRFWSVSPMFPLHHLNFGSADALRRGLLTL